MWNLAFSFTTISSCCIQGVLRNTFFITFHGIFMGPEYDLGDESGEELTRRLIGDYEKTRIRGFPLVYLEKRRLLGT